MNTFTIVIHLLLLIYVVVADLMKYSYSYKYIESGYQLPAPKQTSLIPLTILAMIYILNTISLNTQRENFESFASYMDGLAIVGTIVIVLSTLNLLSKSRKVRNVETKENHLKLVNANVGFIICFGFSLSLPLFVFLFSKLGI